MKNVFAFLWDTAKVVGIALLVVIPIRMYLFQPFLVRGDSMKPNFHNGDYLIIDELSYRFQDPQRGDVIVFKFPEDTRQRYIKRIIGLPGEIVSINNDTITISKDQKTFQLKESYIPTSLPTLGNETITLGNNEYFVLGDNRPFSSDSRVWGTVPAQDIIGKVALRVFPLNAFAAIAAPSY